MYAIYCQKTGGDIEDVIELLEEGNPFRLIFEIVEMPCSNEDIKTKMDQLRQSAPAEAKAVEAAKKVFSIEEAKSALSIIREAESEGSELAAILQVIYKAMVFPVVMDGYESWSLKAECQRIDAFEIWCWGCLLRVSWTARRSKQSIQKEISLEYSVEGLMLKLKL